MKKAESMDAVLVREPDLLSHRFRITGIVETKIVRESRLILTQVPWQSVRNIDPFSCAFTGRSIVGPDGTDLREIESYRLDIQFCRVNTVRDAVHISHASGDWRIVNER